MQVQRQMTCLLSEADFMIFRGLSAGNKAKASSTGTQQHAIWREGAEI